MKKAWTIPSIVALAALAVSGQELQSVQVCDLTAVNNVTDCYYYNTSSVGALKLKDYRITNPATVLFDPAVRLKELAAIGAASTDAMCHTPPAFAGSPPSITFDKATVTGQIYWVPLGPANGDPFEFMDVQFSNFTASNGFSSARFGFRMIREILKDGTESTMYQIQVQPGNSGLENIPGLTSGVGIQVDPSTGLVNNLGKVPSSDLLRAAIFGVFVNAKSVLDEAKFTITTPAPSGRVLWTQSELSQLAAQMSPMILEAKSNLITLPPPLNCGVLINGYTTCTGHDQVTAFFNMLLSWGGEYLGLRTQESFDVLVGNLRAWASANVVTVDPSYSGSATTHTYMIDVAKELAMLWPTLREDPALSTADRQLIENWLTGHLVAYPSDPDYFNFPNDLGEFGASTVMADAVRRSDNADFEVGVQRFYGSLLQMRPDGSFPLSARLSACSAIYTGQDIGHLTSIAEMAAAQGYDLYSLSVNGKSLETGINFFLDSHDNPALLYQYSKAGGGGCFEGNPGDPPDFNSLFAIGSIKNMPWMETYLARFPFSATAARIRAILGSDVSAAPFPLMNSNVGVNTTCAFRKPYEFKPVNGVKIAIVSGDSQAASTNPAPLTVRVTDNSGKALAGVMVSFAITQGSAAFSSAPQVLTDDSGAASATVSVTSGPASVTATAMGISTKFTFAVSGTVIYAGGIAGIGGSVPAVTAISPGGLFSIYGQNFVPAGTGRRVNATELVNGALPTTLLGVCVSVGGQRAPLLDVLPGQINAVVPSLNPPTQVDVIVTTGCGTQNASDTPPQSVAVAPATPEFFYFAHNADGRNPVAAVNAQTGAFVGPSDSASGFAPARRGDLVAIFLSGIGATTPAIVPGATAAGAAPIKTSDVVVKIGSTVLAASDVLYVGAAPGQLISQLNIRIPQEAVTGSQPVQIRIGTIASAPGAYLEINAPTSAK